MDELLLSRVPQSQEAEQAILGSMLIDPACIPEILKDLRPEHFFNQTNREIFETAYQMFSFSMTIDPVTVIEQMKLRGVYHADSTEPYMVELMRVTPTAANVREYAAILRDKALQRNLGRAAAEITAMVNEGLDKGDKMLEDAERKIYALRRDATITGLKPVGETVSAVYQNLMAAEAQGGLLPGLTTGLTDLDNRIMGMNPGELILIASRPGMGKTSIALNIALDAAKASGKTVAIFSLEMSREQLVTRLLSGQARIDAQKLLRVNLNDAEWLQIAEAAGELSRCRLLIDDNPTLSVADMNAQCRRVGDQLALVVIDYLQLMQSAGKQTNRGDNRQVIVSEISRMLKIMAKELNVPVLCLSQLSRASETRQGNHRPMLSDLRESGAIEQDADVVIGLYREGYYDPSCENPNSAEAIVLKNRKGEVGTVPLLWQPSFTKYVNMTNRVE